jgi:flagellar hook-associated protein 3 FlgL
MSTAPIQLARVSALQMSYVANESINSTQSQILQIEQELSTGKAVNQPSDNPSAAAIIQQLQKTLDDQSGFTNNVNQAQSQLGEVDSTLGDLTNLLTQAQSIASANVSSTVTPQQRASAAAVVDSIYNQALQIANQQFEGSYLFGGDQQTTAPYVNAAGGVKYVGSNNALQISIDQQTQINFQVTGNNVFGGTSGQVVGSANLSPSLQPATRLMDLAGATSAGISQGAIQIGNGTTTATVDLTNADTVQDVVNDINNAGLAGVTASLGQYGLQLTATAGANITVNDLGGGTTAADLGILQTVGAGANVAVNGANVGAKVTDFTPLTALKGGAGIDMTGFTIQTGSNSKTISVNGTMTVQDLLNEINGDGLGVTASINSAGTGINVQNAVQGASMTISENGGTTASDLGVRSLTPATPLADLNNGVGVRTATAGTNDFSLNTADGSTINVSLAGAVTVQDVINQINTAAAGKVTSSFSTTGNGIVLTDNTAGGATFSLTPLNASSAAADLGLTTAASGNKITGTDTNQIEAPGIFTDLQKLSAALRSSDLSGITTAAEGLTTDSQQVTNVRGSTGAIEQELTSQQSRLSDENTATQSLLSQFQDVNYTTAITQYTSLQNSLQASLETSARTLNLSLLDYLT